MTTVFFSYSHKDEALRDRLEIALAAMKRQGLIDAWHDRRIVGGEDFALRIDEELERADLVLLLVSPDFINSDYCYGREMTRALERHGAGEAVVLPVILRPSDWHDLPFGRLQAAPKDGRPVTKWPDLDDAFLDVVSAIKGIIRKGQPATATAPIPVHPAAATGFAAAVAPPPHERSAFRPRSSNLAVAKRFSEADRDRFFDAAFEYIASHFENSLAELADRNADIETDFKRVDGNTFNAAIYRDGEAKSRCTIARGGMIGRGITFSIANRQGMATGYNESLGVESDDQGLYLKAMGMMSMYGNAKVEHLSQEGAAEYYWDALMRPLQPPSRR